jgi:hypothetical protein
MTQHLSEAEQEQIIAQVLEKHPDATIRFDGDKVIVGVAGDELVVPILPMEVLEAMDRPRRVLFLPPLKRPRFYRHDIAANEFTTKQQYDPCPCNSGKKFKFCCMGK